MTETYRDSTVLRIDVRQEGAGLRTARAFVREHLEARGVDRDRMDDALIVAGELLGNAVRHGQSEAGFCVLHLHCTTQEVRITVSDFGSGFRLAEIRPVGSLRGESRVGGFGIPLVKTLCSRAEWTSSEAGTSAEAVVSLDPAQNIAPVGLPLDFLGLCEEDAAWLLGTPDAPGPERELVPIGLG